MVYVHVPFCRSFCTYCGFYSELAGDGGCFGAWASAVAGEALRRRPEIEATLDVNTLYLGGGTPSVLPLDLLSRIVEALPYGPFTEFTIEANPDDIVSKEYVQGLLALGVNRVSLGVQSFDDGILRFMNRRHDAAGAVSAIELLRSCGVGNISIDLIFGVSGLSLPGWEDALRRAVELRPEHISAYQLSVEEGSALEGLITAGRYSPMPDEECREQYDLLCRVLGEAGYVHYEVSNFALPGYAAQHNSAYWKRQPYVGLGPGAHSFDGAYVRRWNGEGVAEWSSGSETLDAEEAMEEAIMLGLRTSEGIPAGLLSPSALSSAQVSGSLVPLPGGRVRIPEDRFFVSDDIIASLV